MYPPQLSLDLPAPRGGARVGAGRKKKLGSHDSPHRERAPITRHVPVHVVLRTVRDVGRLRRHAVYHALHRAIALMLRKHAMRVVHVSIQHNHLHFLVEAEGNAALASGMQALAIMAARAINRVQRRRGKVFAFRYHATPIRSPRQMRNALSYVLNNWRRHHEDERAGALVDAYSSARSFDGWSSAAAVSTAAPLPPLPVAPAESWLLRTGWRRYPAISPREVPAR